MIEGIQEHRKSLKALPNLMHAARRVDPGEAHAAEWRARLAAQREELEGALAAMSYDADDDEIIGVLLKLLAVGARERKLPAVKPDKPEWADYSPASALAQLGRYVRFLEGERGRLQGEIPYYRAKLEAPVVINNPYVSNASLGSVQNNARSAAAYAEARERHYGPLRQKVEELEADLADVEDFLAEYRRVTGR